MVFCAETFGASGALFQPPASPACHSGEGELARGSIPCTAQVFAVGRSARNNCTDDMDTEKCHGKVMRDVTRT